MCKCAQVLIRKDKHSFELVARLFGRKTSMLSTNLVVKSIIWPELYFAWRANFLKRSQDCLKKPRAIAVNEVGTLLVVDSSIVFRVKLSNPVNVTTVTGGATASKAVSCTLQATSFSDASGIAFIARDVAIVSDCNENELKILHLTNEPGTFTLQSRFQIERPYGVATIERLDATAPGSSSNPRAVVAVTEYERSTLLILFIEQSALVRKPYAVHRAFRVSIAGPALSSHFLPLRGVAALSMRRVAISVLRARRDQAISDAGDDTAAVDAARSKFTTDSHTSTKVYVTRQGNGGTASRSVVIELDIASVLTKATTAAPAALPAQNAQHKTEEMALNGTVIARLEVNSDAGPVSMDANEHVLAAASPPRIIRCVGDRAIDGEPFAGTDEGWWPNAQPKDGVATQSTFGCVVGLAAFPVGRTVFGLDGGGGVANSMFKLTNLDGCAKWVTACRTQYECFGGNDPTMMDDATYRSRRAPGWGETLPNLAESARTLDEMLQRRLDAIGLDYVHGPHLWMDANSLRYGRSTTFPCDGTLWLLRGGAPTDPKPKRLCRA